MAHVRIEHYSVEQLVYFADEFAVCVEMHNTKQALHRDMIAEIAAGKLMEQPHMSETDLMSFPKKLLQMCL